MKESKIPGFVTDLTNYLVAIKNLSQIYVTNMTVTIEQFLQFINVHKLKNKYQTIEKISLNDVRSLNNSDIYSFIYYLAECHYKLNSRVVKTEHLRTFFEYLYTIKHSTFTEPFKRINCERKLEQKLPNYLSLEEAKKVVNAYSNSSKISDIRSNAMIHIFLNCGLRLSEVVNLNVNDINLSENRFSIIGKGNKERIGYLNEPTKKALLDYLEIRNNMQVKTNALFLSIYNKRISEPAVKKIVKRAYTLAGIDKDLYSTHTLRHTCATLLYRNGTDIKTIQELLGHVQIDTTEIYTHLYDKEVMNAMLQHPLSQFKMANAMEYCAA